MATLSVITLTLNEERNIDECLESVSWADEIVVVDSGSTDATLELARRRTDKVFCIAWNGYGPAKNFALEKATGDWIFWLDADERVTPELAAEIRQVAETAHTDAAAFAVPRRAYFLGRWIRHCGWYPSRVTRLFRRGRGQFSEARVHERLLIDGPVLNLRHDLLHYTDLSLDQYFAKFNRYTSLAAQDMHAAGRTFSLADLIVRPAFTFFKMYLVRRGFLDGMQGFILCVVSAAYVFTKYAKLWELRRKERTA